MNPQEISRARLLPSQNSGHYHLSGADIQLPLGEPREVDRPASTTTRRFGWLRAMAATAGLATSLAVGTWWFSSGIGETGHANWQHVAAASAAATGGGGALLHVTASGDSQIADRIELTSRDLDHGALRAVRYALRQHDQAAVTRALVSAQHIPARDVSDRLKLPELTPDSALRPAVEDRSTRFFRIFVADCCDVDGDVVEILVNGSSYVTIPITHEEAALSIPLAPGANTLTLRGVEDGRGGITVKMRTSRGDFYCGNMRVGEEYPIEVVTQ